MNTPNSSADNRPLFIVNPAAGRGKTGRTWPQMKATIEAKLGPIDVSFTNAPGHGITLARDAAEAGRPLVVAVGGDGTFHEIVNGVAEGARPFATASEFAGTGVARDGGPTRTGPASTGTKRATDVGILAQGTGGDFRRTLGLEHRLDRYLDALAGGRSRPLDLGKATFLDRNGKPTTRWFVNVLSAGMGGLVDQYVQESGRALGNAAAYWFASLRALMTIEAGRLRCTVTGADGTETVHEIASYMVAICNGRYFGSGMHVAPMADPADGLFELVALPAGSKVGFTVRSQRIYDGSHIGQAGTLHLRGRKFHLELIDDRAKGTFLLDVDGEPLGRLPLTIEVVPNALHVRA